MPRSKPPKTVKYAAAGLNEPLEWIFPPGHLTGEEETSAHAAREAKRIGEARVAKLELLMAHYGIPKGEPPIMRYGALCVSLAQDFVPGFEVRGDSLWDFLLVRGDRKTIRWTARSEQFFFDYVQAKKLVDPKATDTAICSSLCKLRDPDLAKPGRASELATHVSTLITKLAKLRRRKRAN
jgi:ADP-ribose pyrophosphatase YjhB (NUDIX family)